MIIVKLSGGLGNQMFQYAAAKALSVSNNLELKLDISHFDKVISNETLRYYRLDIFPNIKESVAAKQEINKLVHQFDFDFFNRVYKNFNKRIFNFNKVYKIEHDLSYSAITLKGSKSAYLDGYWQTEQYFSTERFVVQECFSLDYLNHHETLQPFLEMIKSEQTVSIHVRRGDYVSNPLTKAYHGTADINYYKRAITKITETAPGNFVFFIFSDDIAWCKKNLIIPCKHFYISTGIDYHDLYLMSKCKHNIIANSSFSWWAAWLNKNSDKIIIGPKKWFANQLSNNIVPANWLTV